MDLRFWRTTNPPHYGGKENSDNDEMDRNPSPIFVTSVSEPKDFSWKVTNQKIP